MLHGDFITLTGIIYHFDQLNEHPSYHMATHQMSKRTCSIDLVIKNKDPLR